VTARVTGDGLLGPFRRPEPSRSQARGRTGRNKRRVCIWWEADIYGEL